MLIRLDGIIRGRGQRHFFLNRMLSKEISEQEVFTIFIWMLLVKLSKMYNLDKQVDNRSTHTLLETYYTCSTM